MSRIATLIGTSIAVGVAAAFGLTFAGHAPAAAGSRSGQGAIARSAGALAFGPEGILFVGDSKGAQIVAIETGDVKAPAGPVKINVQGLDAKIAGLVGVMPDQIMINDIKVNPVSKNVYVSASRGPRPDAMPLIVRIDGFRAITPLSLDNAKVTERASSMRRPSAPRARATRASAWPKYPRETLPPRTSTSPSGASFTSTPPTGVPTLPARVWNG